MLAWILEHAGLEPGFLIGGVPANFGAQRAPRRRRRFFVIEADEYDTAFFDKRAKFVHYRPRTAILNNLEFDHADIYPDLAAIERQFHHLVRTVPGGGRIVVNAADARLQRVARDGLLDARCERFARAAGSADAAVDARAGRSGRLLAVRRARGRRPRGTVQWSLIGEHNLENALAAIAAARHAGVAGGAALAALRQLRRASRAAWSCAARCAGVARLRRLRASSDGDRDDDRRAAPARRRRPHPRRARAALEHDEAWACTATRSRPSLAGGR